MAVVLYSKDKDAEKKERQETPHLWNLNPDPQLTGMIIQMIKPGECSSFHKELLLNSRARHPKVCFDGISVR